MNRAVAAVALLAFAASCTGADRGAGDAAHRGGPTAAQALSALPQANDPAHLDPDEFSTTIDNRYWPMKPGSRWVYRETDEDGERLRVVVTVSSVTEQIANGVSARVVRDTVTQDGELVEDTFDWYAQHADGTIWYLGEQTAEYEDGRLTTRAGSFEAGIDGAMAGVIMPGEPAVGMRYRQEYYRGEAEDNGAVLSTSETAQAPAGYYTDALLTKDTNALEPKVLEYKLYAPGVGPVLTLGVSGGAGREELLQKTTVSEQVARAAGTTALGKPYD
jgi:hypothetical protein